MVRSDTIAAIATPAGAGGIAVVRVSGTEARQIAARVFRGFPEGGAESHRLYFGSVVSAAGDVVDRALCVVMLAPRSYTGEDVMELHCHGGPLLARSVLASTLAAGARPAERGEFTLRAFLNGRLDLAQAEAVIDLVTARTAGALRAAAGQLAGDLSRAVDDVRSALVGIAARVEVAIDFSEDDVGDLDRPGLAAEGDGLATRLDRLAASYAQGRLLREGIRVAIVGKPNVGKSSLLNRLLGTDRAIVTAVAGTTRDAIEEVLATAGVPIVLVDTAGLRQTADEVETLGVERARRELAGADVALVVLDGSRPPDADDASVLDATRHMSRIVLINKSDLPTQPTVAAIAPEGARPISARTGNGLADLPEMIIETAGRTAPPETTVIVTRERQHLALVQARDRVRGAASALRAGQPADVVAVEIMAALDRLAEIGGRTTPEDVLDRVFSEFCIGK